MRNVGFLACRLTVSALLIAVLVLVLLPPLGVSAAGGGISGGSDKTGETDEYISLAGLSGGGRR